MLNKEPKISFPPLLRATKNHSINNDHPSPPGCTGGYLQGPPPGFSPCKNLCPHNSSAGTPAHVHQMPATSVDFQVQAGKVGCRAALYVPVYATGGKN
jgi:hypothetical protein